VLAHIVNIGCDIAQQRIASPADIDAAVRLGLGYPKGPLELGDGLGPARMLAILRGLHEACGDPRYRPSPWLARRAALGVALTIDEP
jgi:3-hydroxybutyryl-CoA dehydrogenase